MSPCHIPHLRELCRRPHFASSSLEVGSLSANSWGSGFTVSCKGHRGDVTVWCHPRNLDLELLDSTLGGGPGLVQGACSPAKCCPGSDQLWFLQSRRLFRYPKGANIAKDARLGFAVFWVTKNHLQRTGSRPQESAEEREDVHQYVFKDNHEAAGESTPPFTVACFPLHAHLLHLCSSCGA